MKAALLPFTVAIVVWLMPLSFVNGQARWGRGCNDKLLSTDFSLVKAPKIACDKARKKFIDHVIDEMKHNYGGTMVTEKFPHPQMDTPEFVAFFLREFAAPGKDLHSYSYRFERLLDRLAGEMKSLEDPRLDWDVWRAFLLYENMGLSSDVYKDGTIAGSTVISTLNSACDVLWNHLSHNAAAILADDTRRAWWITQLTGDLEARGGRPQRRWFLLNLLAAADTERKALDAVVLPDVFAKGSTDAGAARFVCGNLIP